MSHQWTPLVLVILLALTVPVALSRFRWLRIPVVVGELVAGMLFGRSGLGLIHTNGLLSFLSLFGLSYLMFLSGLEMDLSLIGIGQGSARQGRVRSVAVVIYAMVLGASVVGALWLQQIGLIRNAAVTGFILGSTALTVVVPVLKERGQLGTPFGQSVLAAAVLLDFLSMLLVTVAVGLRSGAPLRLLFGIALFLLAALLLRTAPQLRRLWQRAEGQAAQVGVRGSFALIVLFVALSQLIGIQAVLGSFLAGIIAAAIAGRESEDLRRTLDGIGYGFLIPVFFIQLGSNVNLRGFFSAPDHLLLVGALLAVGTLATVLPGLVLRVLMPWRSAAAGAILLATRLTVTIAGATVAASAGAITQSTFTAIVLMSIISSLVLPALAQRLMPMPETERSRIIVRGGSRWASLVAVQLQGRGEEVVWLGRSGEQRPSAASMPQAEFGGDLRRSLHEAGAGRAAVLLALGSEADENVRLCRAAQGFGIGRAVALVGPDQAAGLRAEGIGAFVPESAPLLVLDAMARAPMLFELMQGDDQAQIRSCPVLSRDVAGRPLHALHLPPEVLLVSLERGGQRILPRGSTVLEIGDRLTALGASEQLTLLTGILTGAGTPQATFREPAADI